MVPARRWLLLLLLAVAASALVVARDSLLLSYRLSSAQRALRSREPAAAIGLLQLSQVQGEKSARWHYLLARAQRRAGRSTLAEQHLARAAHLGFDRAAIDRQRLLLQAQSGQIKQLESRLVELLQADASDEEAEEIYEAMARGYLSAFQIADASRCLKFWTDFQPDNPTAHLWTADLYLRTEKREAADAELRTVLKLQPGNRAAALKLGQLQLELSNLDEAAAHLEQCRSEPTAADEALLGLAECRRRQGATDQVRPLLHEALLLDLSREQAAQALAALGQLALEERDTERAIGLLEQSVALDPQQSKSRLSLSAALIAVEQQELAEVQRAAARQITDNHTRLVSLTRRVVTQPDDADLRTQIGLAMLDMGRAPVGVDWLKSAVQVDASHPAANRALAEFYRRVGDKELAARHAAAARQDAAPPAHRKPGEEG